ncbi:uncharacterized protein [Eurosta solidaginis]|uniref:uncharacterized protein n=1 Tax=Eurosta solidaginis TaxID=178769 RepID=UPI0035310D39
MQEIWCFYKLIELLLGIICMVLHVLGFLITEPVPHNLFYCGTFSSFTVFAFFSIINIFFGNGRSVLMEAIPATIGAIAHIIASLLLMYHAENDFHLMFLTDYEELLHEYFFYCKAQSIAALATGGMYMLHATFAFDAFFFKYKPQEGASVETEVEEDDEVSGKVSRHRQSIELFVLGKWIHGKLMHWKWFQNIANKP